jgi:hypothetical protein
MDIAAALPPATPSFAPSRFGGGNAIPPMQPMAPPPAPSQAPNYIPNISQIQQLKALATGGSSGDSGIAGTPVPDGGVAVTPKVTATGGAFGGTGNSGALGLQGNGGILSMLQNLFSGSGN